MSLAEGTRFGRYLVGRFLGAGGMGEVYRATDEALGRPVALKVLSPGSAGGEALDRFFQEVRAASSLSHPHIVHVYDGGQHDGVPYLAMELVEGESLRSRLSAGPLPVRDALRVARQAASALAAAHAAGIIHRDIKPENLMLRPDGNVALLDFGLAKLLPAAPPARDGGASVLTAAGMVVGSAGYMSPEQARGLPLSVESDLFSLGAVLWEMVSGRRAFEGATTGDSLVAVLVRDPPPLRDLVPHSPPELETLLSRALQKDAARRFQSAGEMAEALRALEEEVAFRERLAGGSAARSSPEAAQQPVAASASTKRLPAAVSVTTPAALSRRRLATAALTLVLVVGVLSGVLAVSSARKRRAARAEVPRVGELARQERYEEAFALLGRLRTVLGEEPALVRELPAVAAEVSIVTDPPGAALSVSRWEPGRTSPPETVRLGTSPLSALPLVRGDYLLRAEKDGYVPLERTFSCLPFKTPAGPVALPKVALTVVLHRAAGAPPGMSFVPGGDYALAGWARPASSTERLPAFFIDRSEVSNRAYREFVHAGGYARRALWTHPVVKDGRTLTWEEAISGMRDASGLPGPRGWSGQTYPAGQDDLPVTGVTWYEAAAFAEWSGKELPTIFQWDKAARDGQPAYYGTLMPWGILAPGADPSRRANLGGTEGPLPVDSLPFAASPYGCRHLAGNVAEWCRNEAGSGRFYLTGGAWDDPYYQFGSWGTVPGVLASSRTGFRCVKRADAGAADSSGRRIEPPRRAVAFPPMPEGAFAEALPLYAKGPEPLDARVTGRDAGAGFTRERIVFRGARGRQAIAYLYLPTSTTPPFQVVHLLPSADVGYGYRSFPEAAETLLGPLIRGGRAVFGVVLAGYTERPNPPGTQPPAPTSEAYVDLVTSQVVDLRRGLDVLTSRTEVDASRVALAGISSGANLGVVLSAVDDRHRSLFLHACGVVPSAVGTIPAANRLVFAPRLSAPKLVYNGRYDEVFPLDSAVLPFVALMPEPKRTLVYEGGHTVPVADLLTALGSFLDETLGPVR